MEQRETVLKAARAMLASANSVSVEDVRRRAGVSRASMYRWFRSRAGLFAALGLEPTQNSEARILDAALRLIGRDGLSRLSLDEVAQLAGVSRANLYRLFAGKTLLFEAVMRRYSPIEIISLTLRRLADQPPHVVMPQVASALVEQFSRNLGVVRIMFEEIAQVSPEFVASSDYVIGRCVGELATYVGAQMEKRRLRRIHPLLAVQAFLAPLLVHVLTRPLMEQLGGLDVSVDQSARDLTALWLRGMSTASTRGSE